MSGIKWDQNITSIDDYRYMRTSLLGLAMFGLAIVTIIGNTIVIYALRTDRHLRTVRLFLSFENVRNIF